MAPLKGSVLIVYEHKLFAEGLRQMLAGLGLNIMETPAGSSSAGARAQQTQPDFLILECDGEPGAADRCREILVAAAPGAVLIQLSLRNDLTGPDRGGPWTPACREDLIEMLKRGLVAGGHEDTGES